MLGRMTSESNPETGNGGQTGTITYTYDSVSPCGDGRNHAYPGSLVQKRDNAGNITCYDYDALGRLVTAGNSSVPNTILRQFSYDSESSYPQGVTVVNGKTHMVEAKTVNTSSPNTIVTDEFFSYSPRGMVTDVYELTPHSGGYYHVNASYWPTGLPKTLSGISGVPAIYYGANGSGLDGEGRITQITAASGQNPVTGATYSTGTASAPLGALTSVTFGSADSDSFTYDVTGRLASYTFLVNGQSDVGTLTWNPNGTLQQFKIVNLLPNTSDSQICNYGYDDLRRVSSVNCGMLWAQNFTYDAFGNINKAVPPGSAGLQFQPAYRTSPPTNQFSSLGQYDANGNLLTDNLNTYTWDPFWGSMLSVNNGSAVVTATYDAFGRMVENNAGGSYTELLYGPAGSKLATLNGQSLIKAWIALPGGAKSVYNSAGLAYYRHSDWLGSSRLTSTATTPTTAYSVSAYAPFGEQYATSGASDASFTGQDQDTVASLYDFPLRRYSPSQGRWISPDPSGGAAVRLTNPQSWNRYAYVNNNPLIMIDSMGLDEGCDPEEDICWIADDDGGGGGDGASTSTASLVQYAEVMCIDCSTVLPVTGFECYTEPPPADFVGTLTVGPLSADTNGVLSWDSANVVGLAISAGLTFSPPTGDQTVIGTVTVSNPGPVQGQAGTNIVVNQDGSVGTQSVILGVGVGVGGKNIIPVSVATPISKSTPQAQNPKPPVTDPTEMFDYNSPFWDGTVIIWP